MDSQLIKQLNRRRLILENSLETSIKDENKFKKIDESSLFVTDIISLNNTKTNFLEKIKKFESFNNHQVKVTHQNIADRLNNNTKILNKSNKLNIDPVLKKNLIINKLEFEPSKRDFIVSKQNQGNLREKIKWFESHDSFVLNNKMLKGNTDNIHPQTSKESIKPLKTKVYTKSDYNNWKLDNNWTFYKDSPTNGYNTKNMVEKKHKLHFNMKKCNKELLISKNNTHVVDNNVQKNDKIPFELDIQENMVNEKKLQLLSLEGWENYQKELIRLCFEYWEVNETQEQVNDSLKSDLEISSSEIQTIPLFPERKNFDFKSKATLDNVIVLKRLQNEEYVDSNDHLSENKHEDNTIIQCSKDLNKSIDWKTNENCLKIINIKENKRAQKKKVNKISFYKHMSNRMKRKRHLQPCTFDTSTSSISENLWKCEEWVESLENIKKHNPYIDDTSDNIEDDSDEISCDELTALSYNNTFEYSLDIEVNQMEKKVKKLVESLKEKNRPSTSGYTGILNEHTIKFGSSNKLKCFFKNAFRVNQNEFDPHTLNDYTKYVNENIHAWQTLSRCLEDVRRRERFNIETAANNLPPEDTTTIKYKLCEKRNHFSDNEKIMTDDYVDDGNNYCYYHPGLTAKIRQFNEDYDSGGCCGTGKRRKKKLFNLLNKTTKNVIGATDTRLRPNVTERNAVLRNGDGVRTNRIDDDCNENNIIHNNDHDVLSVDRFYVNKKTRSEQRSIRRSWSDTDLSAMQRIEYDGKVAMKFAETLQLLTVVEDRDDRRDSRTCCEQLWKARQKCFQTAVARLEYVGSTFDERCRLTGLKTLCKVDVLAGLGHSAEAVDLFVSAVLPFSNNPDLMIHKAEAAYDWKFFCHLCMWRHSYKDI